MKKSDKRQCSRQYKRKAEIKKELLLEVIAQLSLILLNLILLSTLHKPFIAILSILIEIPLGARMLISIFEWIYCEIN